MVVSGFCVSLLPTAHFPFLTAHFPLLTAHYPLLTAHCYASDIDRVAPAAVLALHQQVDLQLVAREEVGQLQGQALVHAVGRRREVTHFHVGSVDIQVDVVEVVSTILFVPDPQDIILRPLQLGGFHRRHIAEAKPQACPIHREHSVNETERVLVDAHEEVQSEE